MHHCAHIYSRIASRTISLYRLIDPLHMIGISCAANRSINYQENRRHKRLMARAAKLDLEDLLEIAAAKKWTAPELTAAAEAKEAAEAEGASGSGGSDGGAGGAAICGARHEEESADEKRDDGS